MLLGAFKALWNQLLVFTAILLFCSVIVWIATGQKAMMDLLDTAVLQMKGPWVWTCGWGLAFFVRRWGRKLPGALGGFLVSNETTAEAMLRIERSTYHRNAWRYTVPITLVGILLTYVYGIPNMGVARCMIFLGVCTIYYVGALLLFHFVEVIGAFSGIFDAMDKIEFRTVYSPLHLENLTTYLALTTWIGLVAIYAGFRGTLTVAFQFHHEIWRAFLTTPIVLFLPGTFFYNYYPRYVLRKILQHRVFKTMEKLGTANEATAESLILKLKESALLDSQVLPFLDYKSLPSYLIAVFFILSLAYNNDPAVKAFLKYLSGLGAK